MRKTSTSGTTSQYTRRLCGVFAMTSSIPIEMETQTAESAMKLAGLTPRK